MKIKKYIKGVSRSIKGMKKEYRIPMILIAVPIMLIITVIVLSSELLIRTFKIVRKNIEIIILITLVITSGLLLFYELESRLQLGEKAECNKWVRYSEEYSDFYLTEWQREQCDTVGVEINVPVIKNN